MEIYIIKMKNHNGTHDLMGFFDKKEAEKILKTLEEKEETVSVAFRNQYWLSELYVNH